jgi:hypothetical protein
LATRGSTGTTTESADAGFTHSRTGERKRADEVGEHTAAIDIRDQHHRAVDRLGKAHIGNVTHPQIDLGGGAGTLDEHELVRAGEPRVGGEHCLPRDALVVVVFRSAECADGAALDDDLRVAVTRRLKEHGVHVARGLNAASLRLQCLSAAHFPAIGTHRAVQGHILRLEGRHT